MLFKSKAQMGTLAKPIPAQSVPHIYLILNELFPGCKFVSQRLLSDDRRGKVDQISFLTAEGGQGELHFRLAKPKTGWLASLLGR